MQFNHSSHDTLYRHNTNPRGSCTVVAAADNPEVGEVTRLDSVPGDTIGATCHVELAAEWFPAYEIADGVPEAKVSQETVTPAGINSGPSTFQNLESRLQNLEQALRVVSQCVCHEQTQQRFEHTLKALTTREWDVLLGLLAGRSCKQISHDLNIGIQTIAKHKTHVLEKLQVKTVAELVTLLWSMLSTQV